MDRAELAYDLGAFVKALQQLPAGRGPACGSHSFFRGCHPSVYSAEVQGALEVLDGSVDVAACQAVWNEASSSAWPYPPTWFHGDVAVGNLLAADGRLSAVIDFGTCGVGDPACDLVMAWTTSQTIPGLSSGRRSTSTMTLGDEPADGCYGKR